MNWLQKVSGYYTPNDQSWNGQWVDPSGNIFELDDTHQSWIYNNQELLLDEYDIDIQQWNYDRIVARQEEAYQSLIADTKKEKSRDLDIPEDQVELTEEELERLYTWAGEGDIDRSYYAELVDLLIQNNWIRMSNKRHIHIEANTEAPGFWERADTALATRHPKIWSNQNIRIIVNDQEISSGELQRHGSLRQAVEAEAGYNGYYLMNR